MTKRAGGATPGATTRERGETERAGGGPFGNAIITAEVRYSPVTKQYREIQHNLFVFVVSSYFENRNQVPFEGVNNVRRQHGVDRI